MLEAVGITRYFGRIKALSEVSFSATPGERILILGANGSGKSTLLRICAGLLQPASGSITRSGGRIGHVGNASYLYSQYTVAENFKLYAACPGANSDIHMHLASWGLEKLADRRVIDLSKGQLALVSAARAFICNPILLFLDEPTSSLDNTGVSVLLRKSEELISLTGGIVMLATHDIERLKNFATRYIILREGEIVYDTSGAPPRELDIVSRYLEAQR